MFTATNVHQGQPIHFQPHLHHPVLTNGHSQRPPPQNIQQPQHSPIQRSNHPPNIPKSPINVIGIPSVHIENNQLVVGSSQSHSTRSYTPLKVLGDGSFGTVWLCDWHGTLPPNTPLSPMQCGAGAKPEWAGKRLVAVKRMKKKWEGGWDECQKLKEIESLRAIPFHPNIIPLYDFFLLPASKELYFVFESMEGNLYHLIKARKGRPLAGGLVSSIFDQIVSGLHHIHNSGYFHRDMKPENVLVTTTGLFDYVSLSPIAPPNAPPEKDVVAIIKLADFGLARETKSNPPYTEYVSTRWYRAPEVLLWSRDYSNPVDMWALGTIMAELVNLRPLFPGTDQADQLFRICEVLGDPSSDYDINSRPMGGGAWPQGVQMANMRGFHFRKIPPKDFRTYFDRNVPSSLIECIRDLLLYDPKARLTSRQCLEHRYLVETRPRNVIRLPNGIAPHHTTRPTPHHISTTLSHSHSNHRPSPIPATQLRQHRWEPTTPASSADDAMDVSPQGDVSEEYLPSNQAMDIQSSPMAQEYPTRPHIEPDPYIDAETIPSNANKLAKLSLGFGKKHSKWGLGMFGGDRTHQGLPPVQEVPPVASSSTPSLKRTQTSSSESRSLREPSPPRLDIKKKNKKEAEKVNREAEKQRRALAIKNQREQARAVMQKRNQILVKKDDLEWSGGVEQRLEFSESMKGKQAATGPIRQTAAHQSNGIGPPMTTVNAASGRFASPEASISDWRDGERGAKSRRIDLDDDHSMSSSDVHSTGRMSSLSFATVDSDPGPSRIRNRPSLFGLNRMQSTSSLRTSFDDFSTSARSSNSFSLEGQLAHDLRTIMSTAHTGSMSPPPMQMLSISSPPLSPSPSWMQLQLHQDSVSSHTGPAAPPYLSSPNSPYSTFDMNGHPPSPYGRPPSPGQIKTDINPIFKVVSYQWDDEGGLKPDFSGDLLQPPLPSPTEEDEALSSLPPFSELEAIAGGGYEFPPLSPMSFTAPAEDS